MSGALDGRWATGSQRTEGGSSRLDVLGERAAAVGVGLLIVTGFASSYTTLRNLAVDFGGFSPWLAPVVPLSFDLGIVVLSLKVVLAARAGRDARVLRALVLVLSALTVVANGAASATAVGRLLHAVPPAIFVVCFETLAASARHDARTRRNGDLTGPPGAGEALPVLTAVRWLLAPRQTWSIWRARVLAVAPPVPTASRAAALVPSFPAQEAPERLLLEHLAAEARVLSSPDTCRGWPADELSESSVAAGTGAARPPLPAGHLSAAARTEASPAGHHDRLAVAVDALRADPAMTAVALAEHLGCAGHPVSARTAQRIRHQAAHRLSTPIPDAPLPGGYEGRPG